VRPWPNLNRDDWGGKCFPWWRGLQRYGELPQGEAVSTMRAPMVLEAAAVPKSVVAPIKRVDARGARRTNH
jgi:hypothetical protein